MPPSEPTSYDEIPYESSAFTQTHPDRLATIGRLFGLDGPAVETCRVLELGCAAGANLIPMAYQMPGAGFVGLDLSATQIETGRRMIQALSLDNIRLECADIARVGPEMGRFDYILCHGVYSWVPDSVQTRILEICSRHLTENGIAYISYNTYPGWHMREMIRRMMLYHSRQFDQPRERIEQARAMMDFMARSVPTENNYFGLLLRSELDLIRRSKDSYLFHEHLEEINAPLYFHEFAERAQAQGLQYLGEADFATMLASGFPRQTQETLNRISPGIIALEQYMDFLRNRQFRQTLLCRAGHVLKRNVTSAATTGLLVASAAYPLSGQPDLSPGVTQTFQTPEGATVETASALTKAAMLVLKAHWPKAISRPELESKALALLRDQGPIVLDDRHTDADQLAVDLLQSYTVNAVAFHTWQADFTLSIADKPQCSALARHLMKRELPVVNQRHEGVRLDFFTRQVGLLADGGRNQSQLLDALVAQAEQGDLEVRCEGARLTEAGRIRPCMQDMLEKALGALARLALLLA